MVSMEDDTSEPGEARFVALKAVVDHLVAPPEEQWQSFQQLFHARFLKEGEYFIRVGEPSEYFGFINAGLVRFFYQTPRGTEFNKSFSQENQFMGAYSAFLTNQPARFNIQALEQTHMLIAKISPIIRLFNQHPCWEKLGRLLAEQLYIKKEQREAEFLLDDAETRYRHFLEHYPDLENRLAQYHIASYLGITPVALSRIRKKRKS
ncbi:MAG: Crp/Fnr family transcriptional regulator [Gammaproteobacteria bacterium]|nr:Crp/Fnr family transcriptional regulator [Gammaproteobacteria bacterium]